MPHEPQRYSDALIRPAEEKDLAQIVEIYNQAVDDTVAIWNNDHVDVSNRLAWLIEHREAGLPILVAEVEKKVAGYASLSSFRDFQGYAHTVEDSIYIHPHFHRRGLAKRLLEEIVRRAEDIDIHVIVAAIEGENQASIALHSAVGFKSAGVIPQCGTKFDRWLDLHFMYLIVEEAEPFNQ